MQEGQNRYKTRQTLDRHTQDSINSRHKKKIKTIIANVNHLEMVVEINFSHIRALMHLMYLKSVD